ncbi:MAG: hypothetical protein IT298_13190 [Chloroflexi bacterium]|nr:MAG: hypothetical protein UZ13_02965 [Chloroflexi bacterium OLB13]MBV6438337.1 hypothetical protein [Anaerolineae bacterium]MCC6566708.1 hypothetical protein [Chloroflexota bacterium]
MTENPNPDKSDKTSELDIIKIGFIRVPRDQVFPLVMALIVLTAGVGIVVATTGPFQLAGLVVIVVGFVWVAFIYQNAQNRRKSAEAELTRVFDLTITVLSAESRPVKGALVTVLGPVPFTDKQTNKDGRVVYKYTGRDANSYRNRDVTLNATHEGRHASRSVPLPSQTGHFVDLVLSAPGALPGDPLPPADSPPKVSPAAPAAVPAAAQVLEPENAMAPALFQRVVQVITPHVSSQGNQSALVNRAFFGSPVVNKIQVGQAAGVFANHVVRTLYDFDGNAAIITLLETLRADVGANKQREIDTLIEDLR